MKRKILTDAEINELPVVVLTGRAVDLSGLDSDQLNIVRPVKQKGKFVWYVCRCKCGNSIITNANNLANHRMKSCGCGLKDKVRNRLLVKRCGTTLEQKEQMFVAQGRKCACCRSVIPKSKRGWMLDHDHETGRVRGVVCHPCNIALGLVNDSIEHLKMLIEYLQPKRALAQGA